MITYGIATVKLRDGKKITDMDLPLISFSINSIWAEYIPKRGIQGAPLMERRSTAYEDLTSKALLRCLVAVSS